MNDNRSMLAWLGVPLVAGILLLGLFLWMGTGRWSLTSAARRAGAEGGPQLPKLQGAGAEEKPPEPDLPAISTWSEEDLNALLDELLRKKVQGIGAMENEALLRFKTKEAYEEFLRRAGRNGLTVLGRLDDFLTARVGYGDLEALRRELNAHGEDIDNLGANYLVKIPGVPEVEERAEAGVQPFGDSLLPSLGVTGDNTGWGQGVTVAVLDAGLTNHPAFQNMTVRHLDLVQDGLPFNGHGDAMGDLVRQISPGSSLYDIRIFDTNGDGDSFLLAQGIKEAVDGGAQVINVSGASYGDSDAVRQALAYAQANNVWLVAAAGNEQAGVLAYPAAYTTEYGNVIAISAVGQEGLLAYFSNSGGPTAAAPGIGINSAYSQDGQPLYVSGNGTSQATALVAGAVAFWHGRGLNPVTTLINSAKPGSGTANELGAGILYLGPPADTGTRR